MVALLLAASTFCNPMPNLPVERLDLELSVADDGRPVFGNGRLSVVFDAATGFPAEYRRGGFQGLYWLGDHQKTLPAQTAPGLGFDCTFKVVR